MSEMGVSDMRAPSWVTVLPKLNVSGSNRDSRSEWDCVATRPLLAGGYFLPCPIGLDQRHSPPLPLPASAGRLCPCQVTDDHQYGDAGNLDAWGAPIGNRNAWVHGMHAAESRTLETIDEVIADLAEKQGRQGVLCFGNDG